MSYLASTTGLAVHAVRQTLACSEGGQAIMNPMET
jgi:hypothetical protein